MLKNYIAVARAVIDAVETVGDAFSDILTRAFQKRKELLFLVGLLYGVFALTYGIISFGPKDIIDAIKEQPQVLLLVVIAFSTLLIIFLGLRPLFKDSSYDEVAVKNIEESRDIEVLRSKVDRLQKRRPRSSITASISATTALLEKKIEKTASRILDLSSPDKIFFAGRQRLIEESIRIDKISRRNLYFGIVFSLFALSILSSPLLVQAFYFILSLGTAPPNMSLFVVDADVLKWLAQNYLPRFAVAVLFQFVGFFFLRLYVANELDLKHNKNEVTNFESKMISLLVAQSVKGVALTSALKAFSDTERNFIIKKNEKVVSMEGLSEYNDLKSIVEKLVDKVPSSRK